jgi:hypothetical protein
MFTPDDTVNPIWNVPAVGRDPLIRCPGRIFHDGGILKGLREQADSTSVRSNPDLRRRLE